MIKPRNDNEEGFKETLLDQLPTQWKVLFLDEIAAVTMGQSPDSKYYNIVGDGLPLIQGNADCKNGKTLPRFWTTQITKTCDPGDLILSVRAPVGSVAKSSHHACIGRGVCAIKPTQNSNYLFHFLISLENKWGKISQGSTFDAVTSSQVKKLRIAVPPIEEQEKISVIISVWDRAIEQVQRLIEAKQRLKKGLMQGLLTGRLRFPEFGEPIEELGNIPDGWKAVEFHDCATLAKKKIDPVSNDFNFRCVELEHISQETGKIIGETESKQQTSTKNYFRPGNVLFGKLRPYLHKFAYCDFEGVCSSEIWVLQNKSICTSRYLFYLIQTDIFLSASVQTTGTKMPRSDWNVVRKAKFALPTLREQEQITALLDQVELNIELLERYIMRLNQQKKGLMQKLLTGKIRVKVD